MIGKFCEEESEEKEGKKKDEEGGGDMIFIYFQELIGERKKDG